MKIKSKNYHHPAVEGFKSWWTEEYGKISSNDKAVCVLWCNKVVSRTSSVKCHFETNHKDLYLKTKEEVGSVVEWLKRWGREQHCLDSKPTRAILLCPWERHFTAHSPAWWSWQAVLNYSHISIKLQADSNILVYPEAGRALCTSALVTFLRVKRRNIENKIKKKLKK